MKRLKKFRFGDGRDEFYIVALSQREAYVLFCTVGDSRISFNHFRSRLGTRWGNTMDGIAPERGAVWTQRPAHGGKIKRER